MELRCPECMAPLKQASRDVFRCDTHGETYNALFLRSSQNAPTLGSLIPTSPEAPTLEPGAQALPAFPAQCAQHPTAAIAGSCIHCGKPLCDTCAFRTQNGQISCLECASKGNIAATPGVAATPALLPSGECEQHPGAEVIGPCSLCGKALCATCAFETQNRQLCCLACASGGNVVAKPTLHGVQCTVHPDNPAIGSCVQCGKAICATCAFALPGGAVACPPCATGSMSGGEVSGAQTRNAWISLICAIVATLAFIILMIFTAPLPENQDPSVEEAMVLLFLFLAFLGVALVGMGFGFASRKRQRPTPVLGWVGLIWNLVMVGGMVLLILLGIVMAGAGMA